MIMFMVKVYSSKRTQSTVSSRKRRWDEVWGTRRRPPGESQGVLHSLAAEL